MASKFQTNEFVVPMANMNLGQSEVLNQIMDNLNHLNVIVNQAVNTIHFRIKQESELLSSISKRVNDAYKKTELIASNPNKSTTIYSSPNYPENKINSNSKEIAFEKPLINKTNNVSPIKPERSNYNLSIKQRNEKPKNINTLSLFHSLNTKTTKNDDIPNNDHNDNNNDLGNKIPEWMSSVADCTIFGTNCNAYKPSKKYSDDKRRRYQKRKKNMYHNNNNNEKEMASPPPSVGDKYYNLKTQRKTYGDRIRYRYVLDRKNMPKFKVHSNILDAVTDIQWKNDDNNDEMDELLIPSDVLNKRDMNISFEFGDNIEPLISIENNQKTKQIQPIKQQSHHYPTPKDIDNINIKKNEYIQSVDDENDENDENEEKNEEKQSMIMQSVIHEVDAQNKSLQTVESEKTNVSEKKMNINVGVMVNDNNNNNDVKKESVGFVFDANTLKKAKEGLNKQQIVGKMERKEERKKKLENSDGLQGTIFSAMKKLRRFHTDSDDDDDDDEDGSDSFSDSQD